ncbi:MAG: class I SAM-dependent methyltransferase [Victivallaceae bacterium]|nr:class I SAM-dependent methyltransferase [Victivallaceae bacterium]
MGVNNREDLEIWEANADFWDGYMGDESNFFHRGLVRPATESLLAAGPGDFVLDIACGNGNFSQCMARDGARVVAFDFSPRMIELARKRRADVLDMVEFLVCDATDRRQLMALRRETPFTKAVSNMALMDISDIWPLFGAVYELLAPDGIFVFSTHHPCFTHPEKIYLAECVHKGEALHGQPVLQNYYHRPLQAILGAAFAAGFVMDRFTEVADEGIDLPILIVTRLRKTVAAK